MTEHGRKEVLNLAVFVISYETGKVIDYRVQSKFCKACSYWEKQDKESIEYKNWKKEHSNQCEINFSGSSGAMEPKETLSMFQSSLNYKLRYKYLIADGDSKTHSHMVVTIQLKNATALATFKSAWGLPCIT